MVDLKQCTTVLARDTNKYPIVIVYNFIVTYVYVTSEQSKPYKGENELSPTNQRTQRDNVIVSYESSITIQLVTL